MDDVIDPLDTVQIDSMQDAQSEPSGAAPLLSTDRVRRVVEGALFAAGRSLSVKELMMLFVAEDHEDQLELGEPPSIQTVLDVLTELKQSYVGRGIELKQTGSGYRFQVTRDLGRWVSRLWAERPQKYSRAFLETLALVAYRQPITRSEIEDIRGVAVSSQITKTLIERDWIRVIGHKDVPGRPAMYATTKAFLDYFNLASLEDLPPLSQIKDVDSIAALFGIQEPLSPNDDDVNQAINDEVNHSQDVNQDTDEMASVDDSTLQASHSEPLMTAEQESEPQVWH